MSLTTGTRLGPYEIQTAVGAGGMGEVYKARDTRLDRTVAIKILPAALAGDPQLRERFEREAKSISALDHPNICALYDVGKETISVVVSGGPGRGETTTEVVSFLVMQYLEGETLAARLAKGALPLTEALRVGIEIASALDKAHRLNIVHRDLKPGNVMLTKTGAKLLDFGLAKLGPSGPVSGGAATAVPTAMAPLTAQGTILGTFQYMAPEQIEGAEADGRTDIFAFGAVLYEMLTGRRAFQGKSQASLLGAILKDEPPPVSQVQPVAPAALDYLVRTCLAKDPDNRFQTAHDVFLQLRWIAEGGSAVGLAAPVVITRGRRRARAGVLVGGGLVVAAIAGAAGYFLRPTPEARVTRFVVSPPEKASLGESIAFSPDGRRLAFTAAMEGRGAIWVRSLDTLTATRLPGTEGAANVFWSPDGAYIGFFANLKLKKVSVAGGLPQTLCDAVNGKGGAWNRDGVIIFAPTTPSALVRVSASGGTPVALTTLDASRHETDHRWPAFMPDGRHFIFLARTTQAQTTGIVVSTLDDPGHHSLLVQAESNAVYSPPGYLLFVRERSLLAQAVDAANVSVSGDAFPIVEGMGTGAANGFLGPFSTSESGGLAYRVGTAATRQFAWFDRAGHELSRLAPTGNLWDVALSPDGGRVAFRQYVQNNGDIWMLDLTRTGASPSRLTFDPAMDSNPVWSPDGRHVLYLSSRTGNGDLYQKLATGVGEEQAILKSTLNKFPSDWSRDGQFLLFYAASPKTKLDIWVLPLSGERKPFAYLQTDFNEVAATLSPDGKWVAYASDESGATEVYVQSFPASGAKYQLSSGGGDSPRWRADGNEIFYVSPENKLMAVPVTVGASFSYGAPVALFETPTNAIGGPNGYYAPAPGGQRFLINVPEVRAVETPFTVVLNWTAEIKKR